MLHEYFWMGLKNLRKARIRSWLTMLGIFIGIAAVVSLISLGVGMKEAIDEQLNVLGADKVIVSPKGGFGGIGSAVMLTEDDLNVVKKTSGIKRAAGFRYKPAKVKHDGEVKYVNLIGMSPDDSGELIREMSSYEITDGRDLKEGDMYKVVLGYYYTQNKRVFEERLTLRDKLLINDKEFKIIGFVSKIGSSEDDSQIYISDEAFKVLYDVGDEINIIFAKASPGLEPAKVAKDVEKRLRDSRDVEKGEEDFIAETSDQMCEIFATILLIVQIVLIGIASISLVVGGIGIMNTMYTSVLERTREIGIMKAIGATNRDIFLLFFVESGLIGLVGGIVGVLIGVGFAKIVELIAAEVAGAIIRAHLSYWLVGGALLFSFIVGSVSGTLPAVQASKLKPVEALRYE